MSTSGFGSILPPPNIDALAQNKGRLLGPDGKPLTDSLMTQSGFSLDHHFTFAQILRNLAKSYHWTRDEAIRHSRESALAMRRDAFTMGCLYERYLQLSKLKFHLEPENQRDPVQAAVAGELERIIKNTYRWRLFLWQLCEAIWYGCYANQIKVDRRKINGEYRLVVVDHRPVNGDKIHWSYEGVPQIMLNYAAANELIKSGRASKEDIKTGFFSPVLELKDPRWRNRFVIHKHNCIDADFFEGEMAGGAVGGVGIRSIIYWSFFLRDEMLGWAINHLKKIGVGGIMVFYYEEGNEESLKKAEQAAQDVGERYAIAMPRPRGSSRETTHAQLLPFSESGVMALNAIISDYFERHIERVIIGQQLSASAFATGLGSGVAMLHRDTKFAVLEYDAENLADSLTEDLVQPLQRWNFPNADFPIRLVFDIPNPSASEKLMAANVVLNSGGRIKADELLSISGFSKPQEDDETLSQIDNMRAQLELQRQNQLQIMQDQFNMQMQQQQIMQQMQQQQAQQQTQMPQQPGQEPGMPPQEMMPPQEQQATETEQNTETTPEQTVSAIDENQLSQMNEEDLLELAALTRIELDDGTVIPLDDAPTDEEVLGNTQPQQ